MWDRFVATLRRWFGRPEAAPEPTPAAPPPDVIELEGDGVAMLFALTRTRPAISAFCAMFEERVIGTGVGFDTLHAFQVAFDELLTNVVSYAEGGDGEPMGVSLERGDDFLLARIRYRAAEYDPTARAAPDTEAAMTERQIGGLGVFIVQSLMDEFSYQYVDGYNVLTLRKRLVATSSESTA